MVEEDGFVHDGWLKRMVMCMMDGYVHDGWLKRMVMCMMDY
jgi:hypothetical protein